MVVMHSALARLCGIRRAELPAKRAVQRALARMGYVVRRIDGADRLNGIDVFRDLKVVLKKTSRPTLVDAGANVGQTIDILRRTFDGAQIFAFEPSPSTFQILKAAHGRTPGVHLENAALGEWDGTASFYVTREFSVNDSLLEPRWDFSDDVPLDAHPLTPQPAQVSVQIRSLDTYCRERDIDFIHLLKVDTQGYDLHVLHGAREMLRTGRIGAVCVELTFVPMYKDQCSYLEMLSFLSTSGYRIIGFYEQTYRDNRFIYCNACFVHEQQGIG
jgi:FkbM family methyltransferase